MRLLLWSTRHASRCTKHRLLLARSLEQSTAAAAATTSSRKPSEPTSSLPPLPQKHPIPVRHSRKKLPLICTDASQLVELTQQVLESTPGSLFSFQSEKDSSQDAWNKADPTVQKVEFIMRGHAHTLPGTTWQRWLPTSSFDPSSSSDTSNETLQTMYALIERMWDEGHAYMTVREARLEEIHGPKQLPGGDTHDDDDDEDDDGVDLDTFIESGGRIGSSQQEEENDDENIFQTVEALQEAKQKVTGLNIEEPTRSEAAEDGDDDDDDDQEPSYMNDFALPGPTVPMYDALLDAMASQASASLDFCTPDMAIYLLENIISRHELDGGDARNVNPHTRPTVLSFNAPIRTAAEFPYDMANKSSSNLKRRDEAIQLALGSFDALSNSQQLDLGRNSATYTYLLQVIAKYFPPSRIRGNIAHGMFHHAQLQALLNENVLAAHRAANTPTNGPEFDEFMETTLRDKALKDLPHKWRRCSRAKRHHPREATY